MTIRAFLDTAETVVSRRFKDDPYTFAEFVKNYVGLVIAIVISILVFVIIFLPHIIRWHKDLKQKRLISIPNHEEKVDPHKVITITLIGMDSIKLIKGETFVAPFPEKQGYFFRGWFYDSACTESYKNTTVKKDLTLYPKWIKHS